MVGERRARHSVVPINSNYIHMKIIHYSIIAFIATVSVLIMFMIVAGAYTKNVQAVMTAITVSPLFILTSYMMMKSISLKKHSTRKA